VVKAAEADAERPAMRRLVRKAFALEGQKR
jgi:hypothetical protein